MAAQKKRNSFHHGDLRSALLVAAEAMLERVGVEELSLRELTREIGVSNSAPRRHFQTKQDLLDALALQGFKWLGASLNRAASGDEPDFVRRLIKIAQANIRFAERHRSLRALMFATKQRTDASQEIIEASFKALSAGPATIAYGQSIGAVIPGDPLRLALTVFAAVEGLLSLASEGKFGGVPIQALAEEIIRATILGLKPR